MNICLYKIVSKQKEKKIYEKINSFCFVYQQIENKINFFLYFVTEQKKNKSNARKINEIHKNGKFKHMVLKKWKNVKKSIFYI